MHWTGGNYQPSELDKKHYHFLIDGNGRVHKGKFPPSANEQKPLKRGKYAAHTARLNSDNLGVAVCGMFKAKQKPFDVGSHPILPHQIEAMTKLVAEQSEAYGIAVTDETIFTHAESPTNNNGKWDIRWLPGMTKVGDAKEVGDKLRDMVRDNLTPQVNSWWEPLIEFVLQMFKGKDK
jgi:hypothetical protein